MSQAVFARNKAGSAVNGFFRMHRFTVDQYHEMINAGILTKYHKVELLDGWIVDKMPQNPPHPTTVSRLNRWLARILPEIDWVLRIQCAITLATSEPEPDVVVARGPDTRYAGRHPGPRDIALAIEVADSTLAFDRDEKGPLYAAERIPQFWLVNLVDRCVECYSRPQSGRRPTYRTIKTLAGNDLLSLVLDGTNFGELAIKQLLS
jgi:Putative restriction endonuclease